MQIVRRLSINLFKRVVDGASNSVRGKSYAASTVPSDLAAVKRQRKRVSKDERKAMVEAFVNKYRAMNGGKFPPTKKAMKEVGGSYYTIKRLVQELQYNSKMPVEHKVTVVKEASAGEAATRKDKLLTKVEETLSIATALKHGECEDGPLRNGISLEKEFTQNRKTSPELKEILSDRQAVDVGISQEAQPLTIDGDTNSNYEAGAKPQTPIAAEKSFLQEMSRISGSDNKDAAAQVLEPELETFSHSEEPETNIKQKVSTMETFKFDGLKLTDEKKRSPELEEPTRELSNEHKADTQAESNSSMWRNLKSLAAGILNMWRKQ
ncbi:uncharacterized protein LOC107767393 isoform X2 [Nicotiana tabacum]|uniref:Uncharacterized protein LOC107767393 isoform X2 n=1 Tax=Nicotiana tabacum TaxID=4097 RepID=A0A1S3XQC1_TOBAC|nr:uncharacterized protein LOC104113073 isoform X2 [Nicotiana tomentosiformis]XP_016441877.1 PREDICTED: uncharacterized protein LOC107767393 isoform X2 [Nicotiana tabacum]